MQSRIFPFRPWVRKAGASIIMVATAATVAMAVALAISPAARYGWLGEPFGWLYVAALWAGGLRVWMGTLGPAAQIGDMEVVLRPLHLLRPRRIVLSSLLGTEQMRRGDRLILYYDTPHGMRHVALNLNLIKGRREFVAWLDERLAKEGFVETVDGEARCLSRAR